MKILVPVVLTVVSALSAQAERTVRPFNTSNGRTTPTPATQAQPRVIVVSQPGGGMSANSGPSQTPAGAFSGGSGSNSAFTGGRTGRATRRGGNAFGYVGGRRAHGVGSGGYSVSGVRNTAEPAPAPAEEAPAHYSKPGALIRDTGQAPVYEKAGVRQHTVDAGSIVLSDRKAYDVGRAPSVQIGPKDTPPPPNPVAGVTYNTGAAPNGAAPNGQSGGSSSGNSGGNNNGSGNNGKDKPGDDDDAHGGDKAREASFYDAF